MANIVKSVAEPRGQVAIICRLLPQKPMTAAQILKATSGTTPHNSYSLNLLADRFGFKLTTGEDAKGYKTYAFAAKKAAKPVAKKAAAKTAKPATKAAAVAIKRGAKKTAAPAKKAAASKK